MKGRSNVDHEYVDHVWETILYAPCVVCHTYLVDRKRWHDFWLQKFTSKSVVVFNLHPLPKYLPSIDHLWHLWQMIIERYDIPLNKVFNLDNFYTVVWTLNSGWEVRDLLFAFLIIIGAGIKTYEMDRIAEKHIHLQYHDYQYWSEEGILA